MLSVATKIYTRNACPALTTPISGGGGGKLEAAPLLEQRHLTNCFVLKAGGYESDYQY